MPRDSTSITTVPAAELDALVRDHITTDPAAIGDDYTACAAQAGVATLDEVLYRNSFGVADPDADNPTFVEATTPFDIASITKPLVGATLAMQAVDENVLDWHTPVADLLPPWRDHCDPAAAEATLLQLLNHTSGLADWHPFFEQFPVDPGPQRARRNFDGVVDAITSMPLDNPPGEAHTYSDLGYILVARILSRLFERPLATLARERIFEPLGLAHTDYVDRAGDESPISGAVVTENCPHRNRVVRGTVHDTNTNVLGGVSAHAGVFSTAEDLLAFARHLMGVDDGRITGDDAVVSRPTLRFAWSDCAGSPMGHHLAGWDTPSGERSSAGRSFDPDHTVGHLGFTGTSLWIDRRRQLASVLLTNRVYPTRDNDRISPLRIEFQETILPPEKLES